MTALQRVILVAWLLGVLFGIALAGVVVTQAAAASRTATVIPAGSSDDAEPDQSLSGAPSTGLVAVAGGAPSPSVVVLLETPPPPAGAGAPAKRTPKPSARPTSKPAPNPTTVSRGLAITGSWYDDGPGLYAAVRSFRWGMAPYRVRVCGPAGCIVVTVRDHCATAGRIDLSPSAFVAACGPLSRGLCTVRVVE